MTFGVGDIKCIDSFQFMASSLEALAEHLVTKSKDKYVMFENMKKHVNADKLELVGQTGFDPDEFIDTIDRFEYPTLPPTEFVYSSLRLSGMRENNYDRALNVYDKFKCSKFLDCHML